MSRRKFLKNLGALGAGTVLSPLAAQTHSSSSLSPKKNSPVVISTWIHGMEANAGAWEILGAGGDVGGVFCVEGVVPNFFAHQLLLLIVHHL